MQAEIVTIGTELLLGETVDTNSAWIAQRLTTIALDVHYTVTVGDNLERAAEVLRQSLERSDVVITTGGLGPTVDDITREAVAAATNRELALDEELLQEIACFFAKRNYRMTDNNRKQACLPAGARIIHNPVGTAPSFVVEHNDHVIISLPGVPHEMRFLMENEVLAYLQERFDLKGVIKSRVLRTCGIGESTIDSRIGDLMHLPNPTVGTAAHPGQTDVRITAKASSEEEADALIRPVEDELRARLGEYVFGADKETLADVVTQLLHAKGLRLALVETTTRGELAHRLSGATAGATTFAGGFVLIDADSLETTLRVSPRDPPPNTGSPARRWPTRRPRLYGGPKKADVGLAMVGPLDPAAPDAPPVYFSLALEDGVVHSQSRQGRAGPAGHGWLMHLAMDLVRRYLLGLEIA